MPWEDGGLSVSCVTWNKQRPLFRDPRPRRDLDDGCDCSRTGTCAHLAQPVPEAGLELVAFGADERELTTFGLGEREQLDAEAESGRGELRELRPERRPQDSPFPARLAERRG